MKPMCLSQIAAWLEVPLAHQKIQRIVYGISVDSRLTKSNDLFVALPGLKVDGHQFLSLAAAKGAVAAVVRPDYQGPDYGMVLLRLEHGLHALQTLAKKLLENMRAEIIAVTGSVGKTTTKEFITALLKKKHKVFSTLGNYNSQIGLPLTILNQARLDEEVIVLEMGMTMRGQIKKLVHIAPPKVALITHIAPVHIVNFGSIEEIALAKAEIFSHPHTQMGIYHKESDINGVLSEKREGCKKLSFSMRMERADYFLESGSEITIQESSNRKISLPQLSLPGKHNRHNLLAAIAVVRQFGVTWEEIGKEIPTLVLPERRLEFVEKKGVTFINDSYNASEISMKAALSSLPEPTAGGKRCAVLGGMVDLGSYSEQTHWNVAEFALTCVDLLFCFGEDCLSMAKCWHEAQKPVFWALERNGLVSALRSQLQAGDVVLLKGSCSKEVWKILDEVGS